jgi:uncharacterized membrane protein YcaP (DUF421 family)
MKSIFFDSWESILRTLVITILAYSLHIFLLRTSGKRTLSKMNAFDFIVTIALGSTLATVLLNKNVALADGVLVFILLIYLQYLITYLAARSKAVANIVKSTPVMLVYKGQMLKEIMLKESVNEEEIYAIIREKGFCSIDEIGAVVLETDGSLTVIKKLADFSTGTLLVVKQPPSLP